ncbi:MAG: Smr/MutS family protein [Burkholderiales bacterium]
MTKNKEDLQLFREAVAGAVPLPESGKHLPKRTRKRPLAYQRLADEREALSESLDDSTPWESGDVLSFLKPGVSNQVLRRLRRGYWVVQDQLDLHGLNREEARELLADFLARCARVGLRCVRVIHGKGLGSKNREPVLKQKVAGWLSQRGDVMAFCQARATEGGAGAVVVLLKNKGRGLRTED